MNTRERMRQSNKKAVKWLLENGYDEVWLKAHTKFSDLVYSNFGNYKALDIFNLWDGIAITQEDGVFFIQIKTNSWAKEQPIIDWCTKYKAKALSINVKRYKEEWNVMVRRYD